MHGLIFWALIMAFPGSELKFASRAKHRVLTVDFLRPQVGYKSDSMIALEENAERSAHKISEDGGVVENAHKNVVADSHLDVASLTMPEPTYYTLVELDKAPVISQNIDTNPPDLLKYPQGGQLTVRLWIDEEGSVVKAELVTSQLPPQFSESALESFLHAKFSPGIKTNLPVRSVAKIVVRYAPVGRVGD